MFTAEQIHSDQTVATLRTTDKLILFAKKDVLAFQREGRYFFPKAEDLREFLPKDLPVQKIGTIDESRCFGAELGSLPENPPSGLEKTASRAILLNPRPEAWAALCRAREIVYWRKQHRFCGACRTELKKSENDLALICPECGMRYYPQIAPAVIVAVSRNRGRELLLAHNRNFEENIYGLLAGFVEAGETAEHAVERELMEESGIRVKNIRYLTSQTWPFPNSLMLAYTAEYESGEAKPDGTELSDLGWFSKDNLPPLPPRGSVARAIISRFFE